MKIIYIGSSSSLSLVPLQALIKSNQYEICAVAFNDDENSHFNVIISNTIQSLAINNSIPLIRIDKDDTHVLSQLKNLDPDIIVVSCYSKKLPLSLLSIAKLGGFNIHPSLLPSYRGPSPLFWQFRDGTNNFGVTIHRMDEHFDTGNIISQRKIEMQDAVTIDEATGLVAKIASDLLLMALNNIENKSIVEIEQNNLIADYQSFPTVNDYTVNNSWTAKRIFNFIQAYKDDSISFLCKINGKAYKLIDAYSYQEGPYNNMNGKSVLQEGEIVTFACKDSYIQCKIKV